MTRKQKKLLWRIAAAAVLFAAAVAVEKTAKTLPVWGLLLIFLPAYFAAGYDVLWRAALNIAHGQVFDENFLMALATLGALVIGFLPSREPEFAEAVFVMIFYQTGELFQSMAVGKSRRSISALARIRPDSARVLRDGREIDVDPQQVAVGETILIRPGERVPLDGKVLAGRSDLDTAALTGESVPRAVEVGGRVISGCTNLSGALTVVVEKPYGESTVARVLALVEESAARKSRSEQFITRFARYYTPAVVAAALLLAFLPPLFSGAFAAEFPLWLSRALTFLVISCPCALVISVPLAFFGGIGGASRAGVLVKGSTYLEALARMEIAVFDKTGTLTHGDFAVTEAHPVGIKETELRALAAAAEGQSNHPIARALVAAGGNAVPVPTAVEERAGRGILATVDGAAVAVGNLALMREQGLSPDPATGAGTAVYVARDGTYCGYLLIEDTVREGAREMLDELRAAGVRRTVMLTGDRAEAARAVAEKLRVDDVRAGLLPADKVREVEVLLATPRRGTVAFVGDGINDAPVLSRADVGVAMGALGADAAIEAADVVLMHDDPRAIPVALRHARRTLRVVRENIALALGVKFAVLALVAAGVLGAWQMPLAVFADVGVAVLAILNSMRCLKVKNNQ